MFSKNQPEEVKDAIKGFLEELRSQNKDPVTTQVPLLIGGKMLNIDWGTMLLFLQDRLKEAEIFQRANYRGAAKEYQA